MSKIKQASTEKLLQLHNKTFTKKKITLETRDGDLIDILVDEKFSASKIRSLMTDIINNRVHITENKELQAIYISLLIIKYFTNIEISDDFQKQIQTIEILIDLEVFEDILKSLDKKEIELINKTISKTNREMQEFFKTLELEENKKNIMDLDNILKNTEIFKEENIIEEVDTNA